MKKKGKYKKTFIKISNLNPQLDKHNQEVAEAERSLLKTIGLLTQCGLDPYIDNLKNIENNIRLQINSISLQEIKIGEYIKTKDGYIRKVIDFCDCEIDHIIIDKGINGNKYLTRDEIEDHRKNLIELLQKGDMINNLIIEDIEILENKPVIYANGQMIAWTNKDNGIEDVLTKEQIEKEKYKVGE